MSSGTLSVYTDITLCTSIKQAVLRQPWVLNIFNLLLLEELETCWLQIFLTFFVCATAGLHEPDFFPSSQAVL